MERKSKLISGLTPVPIVVKIPSFAHSRHPLSNWLPQLASQKRRKFKDSPYDTKTQVRTNWDNKKRPPFQGSLLYFRQL
jgi:hypothetical protein